MTIQRITALCLLLTLTSTIDAKIVFLSERDDGQTSDIYVMDDDGSNVERLTDNPFLEVDLRWSPDGLHIAFSRIGEDLQTADVFVMNRDGTALKNITNNPPTLDADPSWSPDSGHIAFISSRNNDGFNIYTIDLLTDNVTRLTREDDIEDEVAHKPDFSPDGRYIVYLQTTPGKPLTVRTMRANGTGINELIPAEDRLVRSSPRWSPDGSEILYGETEYGANREILSDRVFIYRWRIRGRRLLKTPRNWSVQTLSWAGRNAVLIAAEEYGALDSQRDIYRYDLLTDTITNLTNSPGDDYGQDWISDRTYSVGYAGKLAIQWGALKALPEE